MQQKLGSKIRGILKVRTNNQTPYRCDNNRWVKIKGCEFRVGKEGLKEWTEKLAVLELEFNRWII